VPVDPYVYPGTSVLKNKLGIRDKATLEQAEYDLSSVRIAQLVDSPIKGRFDYDHLKAIHRHIGILHYPTKVVYTFDIQKK